MRAKRTSEPQTTLKKETGATRHIAAIAMLAVFGAVAAAAGWHYGSHSPTSANAAEQPAPERGSHGFLAGLRVGQSVTMKDAAGRYELTVHDDLPLGPLGPKITEVGADYVVVNDGVGVSETRIPVYSIKSIVRFKAIRR
jgi:hypothetical protein